MSRLEKRMILLCALYSLASFLSKSFVNVYLYEYTQSFVIMAIYTFVRIMFFPIANVIGGKLIKKFKYAVTIFIGLMFVTLSLVFALTQTKLFEMNKYFVLVAALLTGIGEGLYWFSINSCHQIVTTNESRTTYLSNLGTFNNLSTFIAPFIATFIISFSLNDMVGYTYILYLILILYVIITCIALTINKKDERGCNYSLRKCISLKDKRWANVCLGIFFYGVTNSLTLNLTSIMIYNAAGSGGLYSKLLSFFSIIVVISLRFLPYALRKERMMKTYVIASLINISSTIVLVLVDNIVGAIYFGISNALVTAFYDNSYSKCHMDVTAMYSDDLTGRVVAKEFYIGSGRCLAMAFIVLCYYVLGEAAYLKVAVISLSLFPVLSCYFLTRYLKD